MKIRIFVTGGTFDKEYNEIAGELSFKDSHIPGMLVEARSDLDIQVRTLMMIDSLDMSEDERYMITEHCANAPEEHIVITHGTDTMVETAKVIAEHIKDKTIVLTGAMKPYTFGSSDGMFNLGTALAFVQTLEPGVYITMNGKYFLWNNVRKNKQTGRFEAMSQV